MDKNVVEKSKIALRFCEIRTKLCANSNKIFAEKVGLDEQRASNYCNGTKNPGMKVIKRVAAAFPDINPSWLITGDGPILREEEEQTTEVEQLRNQVAELARSNKEKDDTIARLVQVIYGKDKPIA